MMTTIKMPLTAEELREINETDHYENYIAGITKMTPPPLPAETYDVIPETRAQAINDYSINRRPCPPSMSYAGNINIVVNDKVGISPLLGYVSDKDIREHYIKFYPGDILYVDRTNVPIFSWKSNITYQYVIAKIEEIVEDRRLELLRISSSPDPNQQGLAAQELKSGAYNCKDIVWLLRTVMIKTSSELYIKDMSSGRKVLKKYSKAAFMDTINSLSKVARKTTVNLCEQYGFPVFHVSDIEFAPSRDDIWVTYTNGSPMNNCNKYPGVRYRGNKTTVPRLDTDTTDAQYIHRLSKEKSDIARYIMETMIFENSEVAKYFFGYHKLLLSGVRVPCFAICTGEQGTGKTFIMIDLPRTVLGSDYVTPSNDTAHVTGTFDSIIEEKILVAFDDSKPMTDKDMDLFATKIKSLTTNRTVTSRRLYIDARTISMTASLVMVSNYDNCFKIEKGCRRTFCIKMLPHQGGWLLDDIKHPDRLPEGVLERLQRSKLEGRLDYLSDKEVTQYVGELINGTDRNDVECSDAIQQYLDFINIDGIGCESKRYKTAPPYTNLKRTMRYNTMSPLEAFVYNVIYYGGADPMKVQPGESPIGWHHSDIPDQSRVKVAAEHLIPTDDLYTLYLAFYSYHTLKNVLTSFELIKARGQLPLTYLSFAKSIANISTDYRTGQPMKPGVLYHMKDITINGNVVKGSSKYFVVAGDVEHIAVDLNMSDIPMEYDFNTNRIDAAYESDEQSYIQRQNDMISRPQPKRFVINQVEQIETTEVDPKKQLLEQLLNSLSIEDIQSLLKIKQTN